MIVIIIINNEKYIKNNILHNKHYTYYIIYFIYIISDRKKQLTNKKHLQIIKTNQIK